MSNQQRRVFPLGFPVIAEAFDKVTSELDNEEKKILDRLMDSPVVVGSNELVITDLIDSYFGELVYAPKTAEQAAGILNNKVSLLLAERK